MKKEEIIQKAKKVSFSSNPQDYIRFVRKLAQIKDKPNEELNKAAEEYPYTNWESGTWKPSKEQINALERAIVKIHTPNDIGTLAELRDVLKKL